MDLPEAQPIFELIRNPANVSTPEMYRVFNMGVGFCAIVENRLSVINAVEQ